VKRRVASKALAAMKERVRRITRRTRGRSVEQVVAELRSYLLGWKGYFGLALRTARCGPACRVVWQGTPGITWGPYADQRRPPGHARCPTAMESQALEQRPRSGQDDGTQGLLGDLPALRDR
jgi:hypothetical protein